MTRDCCIQLKDTTLTFMSLLASSPSSTPTPNSSRRISFTTSSHDVMARGSVSDADMFTSKSVASTAGTNDQVLPN